jgi:hypothetical protein
MVRMAAASGICESHGKCWRRGFITHPREKRSAEVLAGAAARGLLQAVADEDMVLSCARRWMFRSRNSARRQCDQVATLVNYFIPLGK